MRLMSASIAATAVITAVRAAIARMAAERPANSFAGFEGLVDEGGGERARQPNPEHDRQASDLVFQVTRWPTSFLRALIHEQSA